MFQVDPALFAKVDMIEDNKRKDEEKKKRDGDDDDDNDDDDEPDAEGGCFAGFFKKVKKNRVYARFGVENVLIHHSPGNFLITNIFVTH